MALLTEKKYAFPGLISLATGYRSLDTDQLEELADIEPGTLMVKSVVDDELSWIPFLIAHIGTTLEVGILMNKHVAGAPTVGTEEKHANILVRDAEVCFESLLYQAPFVPITAEVEEIEDRLRLAGIVLRKNDHGLQHGTT